MHWYGIHPDNGRPIYSASVAEFAEIGRLKLPSPRAIMLIAADTREVPVKIMGDVTEKLLDTGLIEAATWGPDCERLHDIFDESYVGDATFERTEELMTNWFAKDPLSGALFYFIVCTRFEDPIAETVSYLAVSVGHEEWAQEIHQTLTKVVNGEDWMPDDDEDSGPDASTR